MVQLISKDIKFDPNATPWQWTDNEDQVIEKGAQVRVKLLGIRSDVGAMYAIGSIKEDYLGFVVSFEVMQLIVANCKQSSTRMSIWRIAF
jgi:DNA-directed RNA polymerase subunit E'/Rpb7